MKKKKNVSSKMKKILALGLAFSLVFGSLSLAAFADDSVSESSGAFETSFEDSPADVGSDASSDVGNDASFDVGGDDASSDFGGSDISENGDSVADEDGSIASDESENQTSDTNVDSITDENETVSDNIAEVDKEEDIVLYEPQKKYEEIKALTPFTVTFIATNGYIPSTFSSRGTITGNIIGPENMPPSELVTRSGFRLFAWNLQQDGSGQWFDGNTLVTQNKNVYAIWGIEVAFTGNGIALPVGEPPNPNDPADYSPRLLREGFSVSSMPEVVWPNDPVNSGFIFDGWLNSTTNTIATGDTVFYQNASLTAQWIQNPIRTLTFDINDIGDGRRVFRPEHVAERRVVEGATFAQSHIGPFWLNRTPENASGTPILNPVSVPRVHSYPRDYAGHGAFNINSITIHSWRVGEGGTGIQAFPDWNTGTPAPLDSDNPFITNADRTVFANWVYRVYFSENRPLGSDRFAHRDISAGTVGGTIYDNAVSQGAGQAMPVPNTTMPADPVRSGFIFYGWLTEQFPPAAAPPASATLFTGDFVVAHSRTVFAFWIPDAPVTVRFNLEDGAFPSNVPQNQYREVPMESSIADTHGINPAGTSAESPMPHIPSKSGYMFMGWFSDLQDSNTRFNADTLITDDMVDANFELNVYARWVPYATITLDFDGATAPANQVRNVPIGYSLRQTALIWQDTRANAQTGNTTAQGPVLTLPQYSRPSCTGLRESSGPWPRWAPQWQGVFSTEQGGNGVGFGWHTVVTQDWLDSHGTSSNTATVFAIWAPVITFNNNHESRVLDGTAANQTIIRQLLCGQSFETNTVTDFHLTPRDFPTTPPSTVGNGPLFIDYEWPTASSWPALWLGNYTLRGWNTNPDGSGQWYYQDSEIVHNRTLYAIWIQGLSFDPNGAPASSIQAGDTFRELPTISHPPLGTNWPDDPVWGMVDFIGWNSAPDGSGFTYDANTVITQSRMLYAIWANLVQFDPNSGHFADGSILPYATNVVTDTLASVFANIPTPLHADNLRFRHWNTEQSLANVISEPGVVVTASTPLISGPVTFYAQWDIPITFDPAANNSGEQGTIAGANAGESVIRYVPQNGSFNTVFPAPLPEIEQGEMVDDPTLEGYVFVGWRYAGQDPDTSNLTSEQVREKNHTVPITFIAQWEEEEYENGGGNGNGNGNNNSNNNNNNGSNGGDDTFIPQAPPTPESGTQPENVIVIDDEGVPLGEWVWSEDSEEWIFEIIDPSVPLAGLHIPQTGLSGNTFNWLLLGLSMFVMFALFRRNEYQTDLK